MKRSRRNHAAAYKAKVAVAAPKSNKTPAELADKLDVHTSQIRQNRDQRGWQGPLDRQRVRRAAMEEREIRARIITLPWWAAREMLYNRRNLT